MRVISINLNTMTVKVIKKEFPHVVVRGMMWEPVPLQATLLTISDLFEKIFN